MTACSVLVRLAVSIAVGAVPGLAVLPLFLFQLGVADASLCAVGGGLRMRTAPPTERTRAGRRRREGASVPRTADPELPLRVPPPPPGARREQPPDGSGHRPPPAVGVRLPDFAAAPAGGPATRSGEGRGRPNLELKRRVRCDPRRMGGRCAALPSWPRVCRACPPIHRTEGDGSDGWNARFAC